MAYRRDIVQFLERNGKITNVEYQQETHLWKGWQVKARTIHTLQTVVSKTGWTGKGLLHSKLYCIGFFTCCIVIYIRKGHKRVLKINFCQGGFAHLEPPPPTGPRRPQDLNFFSSHYIPQAVLEIPMPVTTNKHYLFTVFDGELK